MNHLGRRTCAALLLLALSAFPSAGAEPWGDKNLLVRDGLQLWLDAGRAAGEGELRDGEGLPEWRDGSGKGRHLRQDQSDAQPRWLKAGDVGVVRFDGLDDHLRADKQGAELRSLTMLAVVVPRQNLGGFRAFLAFNQRDERDYTSGLNIDLGPAASSKFSVLNVEGKGFGGARNLRTAESPFGQTVTLELTSGEASKSIALAVDGKEEGSRPREGAPLSMDEITVGARYYNNGPGPQRVDGHLRCDIAEVLVYDRLLSADELRSVRAYLSTKYAGLADALPTDGVPGVETLVPIENAPAVQFFLPGFTARELPVDLTNINNVKYRRDGTLVALGYDGRVWLLRDSDGDGLEDRASLFWDNKSSLRSPIGMDLTPPGYKHGNGLFVVGKTRCVLIVDTDGDDQADKEIEVAGDWKESFHSVDGLGVAFDPRDGSVYYGRGTLNFTDPLLRDKEGRSHYARDDESAAIIRVAPDFSSREIVATGIRFPVALRFNHHGDLFATDQEGATWVPNGNPFDELLHIQRGRHYGFPARHPQHLPDVIDEPSTFDYTPQHQSTCGLNFNEPVRDGGPRFGPERWAHDALVTGYSRGKLYRTKLVKSKAGYVAQNQILGSLTMLTVDACVAPDGSLTVACHSGGPDWGSGPTGKGKLYKIAYDDPKHPQPVFAWATGARELRVEFDRQVDPKLLQQALTNIKLTAGPHVRAGDRFETLWPGYAIVQAQKVSSRRAIAVHSVQLTPDRRTLVLATDPLQAATGYALTLPGMGRPALDAAPKGTIAQHPEIDLDFDLTGCEATWTPESGEPWHGWLPHFDLQVARELTIGSAPHDALWASLDQPGTLVLKAQVDLVDMLRPAVQPGSQLDYEYPPETVTLTFASPASLTLSSQAPKTSAAKGTVSLTLQPERNKMLPVELRLTKEHGETSLDVHWTTEEDRRPRPLPLRRLLVPWADPSGKASEDTTAPPPELAGGSWARGRKVFHSDAAACAKCHTIHGQGGTIGPDLSNLLHRDYASVLRDITTPSFALNPDHLSYVVTLTDGRVLSGVVQSADGKVRIGDTKGNIVEVDPSEIEELKASPISTMPEGLPKQLGPERMRDLMTFLLTPPPQMPRDHAGPRPQPRTRAEVQAILAGAPEPAEKIRPLRIVLVAGPKDHGPGEHDYPAWQKAWAELLAAADEVEVATAWEWPSKEEFQKADVIVLYQHGDWNDERAADVDAFLKRGGGLVYIHWAIDGRKMGRAMAERTGLAALGLVAFRHGSLTLHFDANTQHPVIRNFTRLELIDESYWKMAGKLPDRRTLASSLEEGELQPQIWSLEPGKGRVFVSIPGHYSWTFDDPLFRVLLLRGIAWTAREPVDRFNDLVWPGANVR